LPPPESGNTCLVTSDTSIACPSVVAGLEVAQGRGAATELVVTQRRVGHSNERGFFETYFGLVEAWPNAPESARLIAICGTIAAAKYGSPLIEPYRKMVLEWADESAPGSVVNRLAPAIFKRLGDQQRYQRWLQRAPALGDSRYMAWLERVKAEA